MSKTNFDTYLDQKLQDPAFASRFEKAGEAWDIALQIARLRQDAGLSQSELAERLDTTQKQISRLESPAYEGHSLRMLRRLAEVLNADLTVSLQPRPAAKKSARRSRQSARSKTLQVQSGRTGYSAKKSVPPKKRAP